MRFIIVFVIVFLLIFLAKKFLKGGGDNDLFTSKNDTLDEKYNAKKKLKETELNRILDKVAKTGVESLSEIEREKLEAFSSEN